MACRCLSRLIKTWRLPTHNKASEDGMNKNFIPDQVQRYSVENINHLEQVNYIYTELADKCIYKETNHGLLLAPLMLGALFQPLPLSQISFPKRSQAQCISASPHSDLPIIYQRNNELEPCFRAVRWRAKERIEKSKPGRWNSEIPVVASAVKVWPPCPSITPWSWTV